MGWRTLATDQLTVQLEPNRLDIGDLRVALLTGKFIIEKNRSINLANVIKPGAEPEKVETPAPGRAAGTADPFPYRVRRVLVSEGRVDFADLSLPTPFGTKIHELKGIVAGISSAKDARAQVKLDGRVDEYGTAKIDGELNTSDPKAFTDISVVFRNVEMSSLTPYSGKFAGRKIDSGKLSVDLKYKIAQRQLAGDNQIVVERLVLGEKVESPEAMDLPLDLAIALLEDSNGVIDLGLPVKGDLDSPEFSFGAVIWKAFVNLLTKIVTSPFRALGALLPGGGEENRSTRSPSSPAGPMFRRRKRRSSPSSRSALQKRPQLKLVVQGRYNPETDLSGAAHRPVCAARWPSVSGASSDRSAEPGPVDFGSPETGKALEAMFAERFGSDALKALKDEQKAARRQGQEGGGCKGCCIRGGRRAQGPGSAREDHVCAAGGCRTDRRPRADPAGRRPGASHRRRAERSRADPGRTHRGEALGRGRRERLGERRTQSGSREVVRMKKIGITIGALILLVAGGFGWWVFSRPERGTTGSVSTHFRWLGPNDKIVVDGFDDPKVQGVACHISRAQTGGVKGAIGRGGGHE